MRPDRVTIGTRGSALALWQAEYIRSLLVAADATLEVDVEVIHTKGDRILDVPLSKIGDKGLFTKELETALLDGRVDLCVHSVKDMPSVLPEGLILAATPERADARDALVAFSPCSLGSLPPGARVATGSLRRTAQLSLMREDIEICEIRGNLDTRIAKVREGQFDAAVLAAAGIERMGWQETIVEYIPCDIMLPAVGQGAIGIECREDDEGLLELISLINHDDTFRCICAERSVLRALEGGCQVPLGVHASIDRGGSGDGDASASIRIDAFVSSLDGSSMVRSHAEGDCAESQVLSNMVIDDLRSQGAEDILRSLR